MSKQMLELADRLAARLNGRCVTIGPGLREEVEAAVAALRLSADSAQDVSGLVQDLPLIWQGWCNAIRLMEDKATVRRLENAAQAAAYEQCAKDLKEALARPERTEPQTARSPLACSICGAGIGDPCGTSPPECKKFNGIRTLKPSDRRSQAVCEVDPADLWDRYCKETPKSGRTPQGAMAFAVDALSRPVRCPNGLEHGACLHPDCVPSCPGRIGGSMASHDCQKQGE